MDLDSLRDGVRDVLVREADAARLHRFVDGDALTDAGLWRTAADLGWPALAIPEAQGGLGLGIAESAVMLEELGRALAPIPHLPTLLAARAIALAGSPAQQDRWLPAIAAGELTCAVTSPGPDARPTLTLRAEADALVLSGEAADLLQGADADLLVLLANEGDGAAYVVVEVKADGVELLVERTVDRTRHLARARFGGLRLPADRRLAGPADTVREAILAEAALALACDAVGGANAIFERTLDYLKTREQFGKPIGSFQALKHRCADHKVALEASRAVVAEAVQLWGAGDPTSPMLASVAKAYACEVYARVAEDAVQLHGGIGFTWEHDCHLFLKRAKLDQALFGATAAHLDRAAGLLLEA
ncbi:MAG TPA: acyl-CoA dehydrogenase family protein [Phenylobacterium sp.]|nr:acyl-CoA dehydrogenase family protein [Phenylobacterium sp.]